MEQIKDDPKKQESTELESNDENYNEMINFLKNGINGDKRKTLTKFTIVDHKFKVKNKEKVKTRGKVKARFVRKFKTIGNKKAAKNMKKIRKRIRESRESINTLSYLFRYVQNLSFFGLLCLIILHVAVFILMSCTLALIIPKDPAAYVTLVINLGVILIFIFQWIKEMEDAEYENL